MLRFGQSEGRGERGERAWSIGGWDARFHQTEIGVGAQWRDGERDSGIARIEKNTIGDGAQSGIGHAKGEGPAASGKIARAERSAAAEKTKA